MKLRVLVAAVACLMVAAAFAEARPILRARRAQPVSYSHQSNYSQTVTPNSVEVTSSHSATATFGATGDGGALAEVNAKRAARGLRPLIHDPLLTEGARRVAAFRANSLLFGHTSNDFSFLPAGASASSAGCAAYQSSYGWMSCCVYDQATYGGAAWVMGRDGKRYMHLFVR